MFKARFFLSLVALGVSLGLALLILQDFGRALATGLITFVACQAAAMLAETRTELQFQSRNEELRAHIRSLQRRRAEAYDDLMLIQQQRDQASTGLSSVQTQLTQLKAQSTNLWRQKEALSWNLTMPLALQSGPQSGIQSGLQSGVGDPTTDPTLLAQQQQKQKLAQDVGLLEQQRQQLLTQVTDLEGYRSELNAFLLSAEPQRQEVEMGSQSLRAAIAQLQSQIALLHDELGRLEGQILDRRRQKAELDTALAALRSQSPLAKNVKVMEGPIGLDQPDLWLGVEAARPPQVNGAKSQGADRSVAPVVAQTVIQTITQTAAPPKAPAVAQPKVPTATQSKAPTAAPPKAPIQAPATEPAAPPAPPPEPANAYARYGLAAEWGELMSQLPASEFQALRAIAQDANPGAALKKLAEAHLTMPEMLIDAINERALDAIGDIILEPGATAGGTIIAQEYRDQIALLITHYGDS
jgi:TerB-C domain